MFGRQHVMPPAALTASTGRQGQMIQPLVPSVAYGAHATVLLKILVSGLYKGNLRPLRTLDRRNGVR
jgi:hypothetical protein